MERDAIAGSWDAIVIGTGIGGATFGYALARQGKRVLFCEKGRSALSSGSALRGAFAEESFPVPEAPAAQHKATLARAGRCWQPWTDVSASRGPFIPFIGNGPGGSSALYGMALERFFPRDFGEAGAEPAQRRGRPAWPVAYAQMAPYYEAAEQLYRVRGARDPLRAGERMGYVGEPVPSSAAARELSQLFQRKGLHPYRLPVACEMLPGCAACQGYLCARSCKVDSARACLEPAISDHDAAMLDECEVLNLEADGTRVTGALCNWRGREVMLRGEMFALAAGALETPRMLLRSASSAWPQGLANSSGLVGKNLMRHFVDLWLVFTEHPLGPADFGKEIAFNDFYVGLDAGLGSVQSFGHLPPVRALVSEMIEEARRGSVPPVALVLKAMRPLLERYLDRMASRTTVLATIVEDFPRAENRIVPGDSGTSGERTFEYRIANEERDRIESMRTRMKSLLAPYRYRLIKQAENNQRLAHACGTCRFGVDPRNSVLDAGNRAHGLSNLYVVDASFFPSSGGTNPGLTIAANALRVADEIGRRPASQSN